MLRLYWPWVDGMQRILTFRERAGAGIRREEQERCQTLRDAFARPNDSALPWVPVQPLAQLKLVVPHRKGSLDSASTLEELAARWAKQSKLMKHVIGRLMTKVNGSTQDVRDDPDVRLTLERLLVKVEQLSVKRSFLRRKLDESLRHSAERVLEHELQRIPTHMSSRLVEILRKVDELLQERLCELKSSSSWFERHSHGLVALALLRLASDPSEPPSAPLDPGDSYDPIRLPPQPDSNEGMKHRQQRKEAWELLRAWHPRLGLELNSSFEECVVKQMWPFDPPISLLLPAIGERIGQLLRSVTQHMFHAHAGTVVASAAASTAPNKPGHNKTIAPGDELLAVDGCMAPRALWNDMLGKWDHSEAYAMIEAAGSPLSWRVGMHQKFQRMRKLQSNGTPKEGKGMPAHKWSDIAEGVVTQWVESMAYIEVQRGPQSDGTGSKEANLRAFEEGQKALDDSKKGLELALAAYQPYWEKPSTPLAYKRFWGFIAPFAASSHQSAHEERQRKQTEDELTKYLYQLPPSNIIHKCLELRLSVPHMDEVVLCLRDRATREIKIIRLRKGVQPGGTWLARGSMLCMMLGMVISWLVGLVQGLDLRASLTLGVILTVSGLLLGIIAGLAVERLWPPKPLVAQALPGYLKVFTRHYRPSYLWFEVIDSLYKIGTIVTVSLVQNGTDSLELQIVIIITSLLYTGLLLLAQPHALLDVGIMHVGCSITVFLQLLLAFVVRWRANSEAFEDPNMFRGIAVGAQALNYVPVALAVGLATYTTWDSALPRWLWRTCVADRLPHLARYPIRQLERQRQRTARSRAGHKEGFGDIDNIGGIRASVVNNWERLSSRERVSTAASVKTHVNRQSAASLDHIDVGNLESMPSTKGRATSMPLPGWFKPASQMNLNLQSATPLDQDDASHLESQRSTKGRVMSSTL